MTTMQSLTISLSDQRLKEYTQKVIGGQASPTQFLGPPEAEWKFESLTDCWTVGATEAVTSKKVAEKEQLWQEKQAKGYK